MVTNNEKSHSTNEELSSLPERVLQSTQYEKLFLLGAIGLVLSHLSYFLAILSPLPLLFASLIFGRWKSFGLFGALFAISSLIVFFQPKAFLVVGNANFLVAMAMAFLVGEMIVRRIHPARGLVLSGFFLVVVFSLILISFLFFTDQTLRNFLEPIVQKFVNSLKVDPFFDSISNSPDEAARYLKVLLQDPNKLLNLILNNSFYIAFTSIFSWIWVIFALLLRGSVAWRDYFDYQYNLSDLMNFKVKEWCVYPVILLLLLFVIPVKYMGGDWAQIFAINALFSFGIFYFFQGAGVILFTLDAFKIYGFFRTVLFMMTIFLIPKMVAFIGLFDLWLNFKNIVKKITEKKDKGE